VSFVGQYEIIGWFMIEDRLLILRFKRGSRSALQQIYVKYRNYLLTLATALLNDGCQAEDVVQDFFISFAQSADRFRLEGSLKWYMARCVANRARDIIRQRNRRPESMGDMDVLYSRRLGPEAGILYNEAMQQVSMALEQLPYEQREVVVLHTQGRMKFRTIAKHQKVSIKTALSRYRYGLDKLRKILNSEAVE
jgi:RNA polymerase sigma-70 factor (ECF subfamily)